MCFAFDARPPEVPSDLKPVAGGAAAERLELTSADGTRFAAALAAPTPAREPGVVILPDVRGLYRFYVELAERFAAAAHPAIAFDYFGRTAGTAERGEDFEFWSHVEKTRAEQVQADAAAAIDALRDRAGVRSVATVGFCFGGTQSFLAGESPKLDLSGVVGFYGILARRPDRPSPVDGAADMRCPVLGLFGGADANIPPGDIDAFDRVLDATGVEHELISYPGAPHSFFDRSFEQHADACEDAWRRTLGFLEQVAAAAPV